MRNTFLVARSELWKFITAGPLVVVLTLGFALAIGAGFGAVYIGELLAPMWIQQMIGYIVLGMTSLLVLLLIRNELR